ncbi:unnamed protein product [Boreogadus saida]
MKLLSDDLADHQRAAHTQIGIYKHIHIIALDTLETWNTVNKIGMQCVSCFVFVDTYTAQFTLLGFFPKCQFRDME